MNYLAVEGLKKYYGEKVLFDDLTFYINKGQKVALVAPNGTGKSSLLRCIVDVEAADAGTISLHPDIKVAYLPQEPELKPGQSIIDTVFEADNPAVQAIKAYESGLELGNDEQVQKAMSEIDRLGAWDIESQVKEILFRLKLSDVKASVDKLSGGQRKRVALTKALIERPDFLILDEPTNHLDLEMIEWLEDYLSTANMTLLMVTHDRYFLENVCNEIIEMEDGILHKHKGSYSTYLENRQIRHENQKTVIGKAKSLMKTELEWVRRMPKARGTKNKARLDAFTEIKKTAKKTINDEKVVLEIKAQRLGSKIAEFHNVGKSYDDLVLLKGFNYKFQRFDRVGIVGPNGVGKSTLLNILTGNLTVDTGKVVIGETVKIGYYSQQGIQLNDDMRVIEVVREIADYIPLNGGKTLSAEALLERFMFSRSHQRTYVSRLSGGERRKLYLCIVLMQNPNFLILDEPTNDLDIDTLNVLEDFLMHFPGCVIIVSHDRYFMDKIVDHLFVFEGKGVVRDFPGTYTHWRVHQEAEKKAQQAAETTTKAVTQTPVASKPKVKKQKLSYNEQREYDTLEAEIAKLESTRDELTAKLGEGLSGEAVIEVSEKLNEVVAELDTKTERWFELAAYVE